MPDLPPRQPARRLGSALALRLGVPAAAFATLLAGVGLANAATRDATTRGEAGGSGDRLAVSTTEGVVRGRTTAAVREFLGIPYAAAPVGELRWRPPQPAAPWYGTRDATRFAPHCAQPAAPPYGVASASEDCLYLNVVTPLGVRRGDRPRPVMVWIHGGGLANGESDDYDPGKLAQEDAIVVTVNYRLGALGLLAHPAFADRPGGASGNYGLMDQQAALRWVQRNIGGFGGDPGNVTIFGESAGGLSVLAQMTSPTARGLFGRAIVQSGAYAGRYGLDTVSLAEATTASEAFAAGVGCPDQTAACLRSLPVSAVLGSPTPYTQANVDGQVLTQPLRSAFANGDFRRVPLVIGTNRDEGRLVAASPELGAAPITAESYQSMIAYMVDVTPEQATAIAMEYPLSAYPSPTLALATIVTDGKFACPALAVERSTSRYMPTYAYEFSDENAPNVFLPDVGVSYGAAHGFELSYLFDLPNAPYQATPSPDQQRLAKTMRNEWVTFARSGSPSSSTRAWPRFDAAGQRIQSLVPPRPQVESGFDARHNCPFWSETT